WPRDRFSLGLHEFPLDPPPGRSVGLLKKCVGRPRRRLVCRSIVEEVLLFDTQRELLPFVGLWSSAQAPQRELGKFCLLFSGWYFHPAPNVPDRAWSCPNGKRGWADAVPSLHRRRLRR